jgi:hypothetical protein
MPGKEVIMVAENNHAYRSKQKSGNLSSKGI